ncbi:MAG TPA: hypothetical protein VHR66_26620 [Gemmataceae bacterium]|jgi:hypothetical protein|nr:hypothetical protein [Gemmataceae bacterium]
MPSESEALRDWHRLFGLILTDFFTNSPFVVEIERDTSIQQQFLDVLIVRRGPGEFAERLPDGLEDLRAHNLITFKSHRETLDAWAMLELIGHYVAYRKLVSRSPRVICFPKSNSACTPWPPDFLKCCREKCRGRKFKQACMIVSGDRSSSASS